jgi:hypothetical protein
MDTMVDRISGNMLWNVHLYRKIDPRRKDQDRNSSFPPWRPPPDMPIYIESLVHLYYNGAKALEFNISDSLGIADEAGGH